ncbi:MAG: dihydropteroate synthase [Bacteroidetes bacterium]|nr:dihydropteroate synthase [Bacteroidota bacterium]
MGIINVSPHSFYDGGALVSEKQILEKAEKHRAEGAQILDIGAVSAKPYAPDVSEKEEWNVLFPVLKKIRKNFPELFISVDTFRSAVARQAANEGADIINDISGGTLDSKMFETVGRTGLPYVLMHIQGTPATMQQNPKYNQVVHDVFSFFTQQIALAKEQHIQQLIIDVGYGFGKTSAHNYQLLKHQSFFQSLDFPLLTGISRKSMVYQTLESTPANSLNGTTVLHTIALLNGTSILRAHDVKEAAEAIRLVNCYYSAR